MLKRIIALFMAVAVMFQVSGCRISDTDKDKVGDIEFTVLSREDIPDELKKIIDEKKAEEFRLTYSTKDYLYIAVGYGTRETTGYSISVNNLYYTSNSIYFDTELLGPQKGETVGNEESTPYIVVKMEYMDYPVIFD